MQTGVKHTCEYRPVDQLIGARSSPHDTRLAKQEEQHYSILTKISEFTRRIDMRELRANLRNDQGHKVTSAQMHHKRHT